MVGSVLELTTAQLLAIPPRRQASCRSSRCARDRARRVPPSPLLLHGRPPTAREQTRQEAGGATRQPRLQCRMQLDLVSPVRRQQWQLHSAHPPTVPWLHRRCCQMALVRRRLHPKAVVRPLGLHRRPMRPRAAHRDMAHHSQCDEANWPRPGCSSSGCPQCAAQDGRRRP